MTQREQELVKALLDVLHEEDGRQLEENVLHLQVNARAACSYSEFANAIGVADRQGFVTGVKSKLTGRFKWNINDAGESARLRL